MTADTKVLFSRNHFVLQNNLGPTLKISGSSLMASDRTTSPLRTLRYYRALYSTVMRTEPSGLQNNSRPSSDMHDLTFEDASMPSCVALMTEPSKRSNDCRVPNSTPVLRLTYLRATVGLLRRCLTDDGAQSHNLSFEAVSMPSSFVGDRDANRTVR